MSATARLIRRAVAQASAPTRAGSAGPRTGTVRFTERQLYYEYCRVLMPLHRLPGRPRFTLPRPIGSRGFAAALRAFGPVSGLVTPRAPGGYRTDVPDLFDYGLPRILLCQHRDIAAMLLANDLHMESACPVFAVDDLPLDAGLVAAMHRARDARVFLLHDASLAGQQTVRIVRRWAEREGLRWRSLGLRPAHAASLHLTRGPRHAAGAEEDRLFTADEPATGEGSAAWESRWLRSGRTVEVAAVNPAQLLRTVHRLVRGQSRARPRRQPLRVLSASGFLTWPAPEPGAAVSADAGLEAGNP